MVEGSKIYKINEDRRTNDKDGGGAHNTLKKDHPDEGSVLQRASSNLSAK